MLGIDLSHHNGNFNFCSNAPYYDFAIVKATEARTFNDSKFLYYIQKLKLCGKGIGCYHFLRTDLNRTKERIMDEVNHFARALVDADVIYDAIVCFDWEVDGDFYLVEYAIDEMKRIYNKKNIFLYINKSIYKKFQKQLNQNKYHIWLADYIKGSHSINRDLLPTRNPEYPCSIWQFTNNGKGKCGEKLDLNYTEMSKTEFIEMYK